MVKQKMILAKIAEGLEGYKASRPYAADSVVTMGGSGGERGGSDNMLTHMLTPLALPTQPGLTNIAKDEGSDAEMGPEARAFLKKIMTDMGGPAEVIGHPKLEE